MGVLGVLQHPGAQFGGPAINGSRNFIAVQTDSHHVQDSISPR